MIAVGFLHPLLLWALPVAAVPIIIHLLNRRRFQTVRWAAQSFLLAALKRNRRRLRMEQWLVLLLRTLAVLLLVLLVTRPQLTGSVLGEVRTHHVVCIDDSASMAHRDGATDAFKAAIDRARALADRLADTRQGDLFSVLRASRPTEPDLLGLRVGPALKDRVRDELGAFGVGDSVAQVGRMLDEAAKRIAEAEEASRAEIYLISDLRRGDWLTADGKARAELVSLLSKLDPERHRLTMLAVGSNDAENLAITDIRRAGRIAIAGVPVDLTVELKNQGQHVSEATEVALVVDDKSRVVLQVDGLEPGESRKTTFTHTFFAPGFHGVVASVPVDRYAPDDTRGLSIEVVDSSQVLIVDGDPGEQAQDSEAYYLGFALEHRESGIAVQVVPDHTLADLDFERSDMIYLCNVPAPDPIVVERLEAFVRAGGGLVVFVGDQVNPARYNERMFRDGAGLLPARLVDLDGDTDRPQGVFLADKTHGTMSLATEAVERVLALSGVGRFMTVSDADGARVILRVANSSGPPLLLSRHFGDGGEVMLVTSTADLRWNSLARTPAYLIITQQMHKVTARVHDQAAYNLNPDGVLHMSLDPAIYRPDVIVKARREAAVTQTFTGQAAPGDAQRDPELTLELPMTQLGGTGLFSLQVTPHTGPAEQRVLARNTPAEEGRLQRLTSTEWRRAFPEDLHDRVKIVETESGEGSMLRAGYGEVWRMLAMLMVGVLLLESVLAWRFGRR